MGRWGSVSGDRRVVSDPHAVCRNACETNLRVAVVMCDRRLSVSHLCMVTHVSDSQVGMWMLCAQLWLRSGGKGLGGVGEFGSGRTDKGLGASVGPLTRRRAVSQSHRRQLLPVCFSAFGPSFPNEARVPDIYLGEPCPASQRDRLCRRQENNY